MIGLMLRDWLILYKKHFRKLILIIPIISILLSFLMRLMFCSVFSIALPMAVAALAMNLFSEDEKNDWFMIVKTMPVRKVHLVIARLAVCDGVVFGCSLFSVVLNCCVALLFRDYSVWIYLVFSGVGFFLSLLSIFIMVPVCFRIGAGGVSVVALVIAFLSSGFAYSLPKLNLERVIATAKTIPMGVIITGAVGILFISGMISLYLTVREKK